MPLHHTSLQELYYTCDIFIVFTRAVSHLRYIHCLIDARYEPRLSVCEDMSFLVLEANVECQDVISAVLNTTTPQPGRCEYVDKTYLFYVQ